MTTIHRNNRRERGSAMLYSGLGCLGVIVLGAIVVALWFISVRNGLIAQRESVKGAWGQVGNVYQRRADLIPNLVSTVKGYAAHESTVLIAVTEARAHATQVRVDPSDPASMEKFAAAQGALSSSLSRLLAVAENYPNLKASGLFQDLMAQLEGTENRITVERKRWNDQVQGFNTSIQQFPTSFVAGTMSMTPLAYFEAKEGADQAPKVSF